MTFRTKFASLFAATALLAVPSFAEKSTAIVPNPNLDRDVRQAINTLSYYDVFDMLSYRIAEDGTVTLTGDVTRYNVRNSAASVVKQLAGVTRVDNQIQVLPLSYFDDNIRIRAYNAIFGYPALSRYAINARPPIRIIVRNGNVTLEGVVNNALDRQLVENRVRTLPSTLAVTNNLRLDNEVSAN